MHVATFDKANYPWYVRIVFWLQRRKYGVELEPAHLWGRMPRTFIALTMLYRTLDRKTSPIEPGLRSLILVRVSQINWCPFCVDLNSATAIERYVSAEKLADLPNFEQSAHYSEREKAALHYAESMTDSGNRADNSLLEETRQHFPGDAIVELTALIAFQSMSSKFNAALQVPAQEFCNIQDKV